MADTPSLDSLLEGVSRNSLIAECSDNHLIKIAKWFKHWKDISAELGITEAEEEEIKSREGDLNRKKLDMLRMWKSKYTTKANYLKLAEVFHDISKNDLVAQLCGLFPSLDNCVISKDNNTKKLVLHDQSEGLEEVMKGVQDNTLLETLNLTFKTIDNRTASRLGVMLKSNNTLKELILHDCKLQSEGLEELMKGVQGNTKLKTLNLSLNAIDSKGASCLGMMLKKNSTLKELILHDCKLQSEGLEEVMKGVQVNTKLEILILSLNTFDSKRASCLGMMLNQNNTLKELNLWDCKLQSEGLQEVMKNVQNNTSLETLHLSLNTIDKKDALFLAHVLKHNKTLSHLELWGCGLSDEAIVELCDGLKCSNLKILNLEGNPFGDQGAKHLMVAMRSNTRVEMLTLSDKYRHLVPQELVHRIKFDRL